MVSGFRHHKSSYCLSKESVVHSRYDGSRQGNGACFPIENISCSKLLLPNILSMY